MATASRNLFAVLGGDDNDPAALIAAHQKAAQKQDPPLPRGVARGGKKVLSVVPPKLPAKTLTSDQAVREARGGGGLGLEVSREKGVSRDRALEALDADKHLENNYRGGNGTRGGRGGAAVGYGKRPPKREFDRHGIYGRGNVVKRDGYGQWNWGLPSDQVPMGNTDEFKNSTNEHEDSQNESDECGSGVQEMTLDEYEKSLEGKKKAVQALIKPQERKVVFDKEFKHLVPLSSKKKDDASFDDWVKVEN